MRLVIAEKPSVAQGIAAVIGAKKRGDGYLEGGGYLVSWCIGHLVELAAADVYDAKYAKWRYEDLPILPPYWEFVVSSNTKKQFAILKKLMADSRVDGIVCATDAGREGELIFRLVYERAGCKKPVQRLWISSMEESAIIEGFQNLKSGAEYDKLYQSALCRAKADWLVGINMTRLFSVLYHQTLNIGRVMTPTLAMIVSREAAIDAFRPEPFYNVALDCGSITATGEKLKDKGEAARIAAACDGKAATVSGVERKEKGEKPPKLYDLTSLQRDANRLYGYTAQQTLDYAQSLYEKKLCTYPRTDSRYLTSDMAENTPVIVNAAAMVLPFARQFPVPCDMGQVIDNGKVTDHHAIIPTLSVKGLELAALPLGERDILTLVIVRLICAVGEVHRFAETTVTVDCAGVGFTARGKTVIRKGWKAADAVFRANLKSKPDEENETALPSITEGQTFQPVTASVKEGKTTPPKHFTEDTLLSAMETAGAEDMPEDVERRGLGTPATRAGILEKLVKTEFVERKGDKKTKYLLPTHKGVSLITVVPEAIQSPQLTAEWEQRLKRIERGALAADDFLADIGELVAGQVKTYKAIQGGDVLFPSGRESIGKCPRCAASVAESKKGFFCENGGCRFGLWKDNKFFTAKGVALTRQIAAALLKDGRVKLTSLHSEKTGKTYDAVVVMEDTGEKYVNFRLEFDAK